MADSVSSGIKAYGAAGRILSQQQLEHCAGFATSFTNWLCTEIFKDASPETREVIRRSAEDMFQTCAGGAVNRFMKETVAVAAALQGSDR